MVMTYPKAAPALTHGPPHVTMHARPTTATEDSPLGPVHRTQTSHQRCALSPVGSPRRHRVDITAATTRPSATRPSAICYSRTRQRSCATWVRTCRPWAAKTRIVHLRENGEGLDFLGFHLRLVRATPPHQHVMFLARWPSRKAVEHARDRIRFLTAWARLAAPPEQVVAEVNRFLRGWPGTFGTATPPSTSLGCGRSRSSGCLANVGYRHQRRAFQARLAQGRARLAGPAGAAQPRRDRRCRPANKPMECHPANDVGEPCAGEPHARIDGRGWKRTRPTTAEPR